MSNQKTSTKPKQIKLVNIEAQSKNINKMETYLINEEQNLELKYYPLFSETKIGEVLGELYSDVNKAKEMELDYFENEQADNNLIKHLHCLILKHFTSLKSEIPNDLPTKINIFDQIVDIGLFKQIFEDVLDPNEVVKVETRLYEYMINLDKIRQQQEEAISQISSQLQNKELTPYNTLNKIDELNNA